MLSTYGYLQENCFHCLRSVHEAQMLWETLFRQTLLWGIGCSHGFTTENLFKRSACNKTQYICADCTIGERSLNSRMLLPRVADYQAVLCRTILPCVPAAPALVTAIIPDSCDAKKKQDKLMAILNNRSLRTRISRTMHPRMSVLGTLIMGKKSKKEMIAVIRNLWMMTSAWKEISKSKQQAQARNVENSHEPPLHPPQSCVNRGTSSSNSGQGSMQTEDAYSIYLDPTFSFCPL